MCTIPRLLAVRSSEFSRGTRISHFLYEGLSLVLSWSWPVRYNIPMSYGLGSLIFEESVCGGRRGEWGKVEGRLVMPEGMGCLWLTNRFQLSGRSIFVVLVLRRMPIEDRSKFELPFASGGSVLKPTAEGVLRIG